MVQGAFSLPQEEPELANEKICEGDYVLIYLDARRTYMIKMEAGKTHTHKGYLKLDELIGKQYGEPIKSSLGINFTTLKPALTVIDGFVGMEGRGPTDGTPVKMDLIIAGRDVVATDATAARIMGPDPMQVSHIRRAYEKGIGNINDIQVVGSKLEEVKRTFKGIS